MGLLIIILGAIFLINNKYLLLKIILLLLLSISGIVYLLNFEEVNLHNFIFYFRISLLVVVICTLSILLILYLKNGRKNFEIFLKDFKRLGFKHFGILYKGYEDDEDI